MARQALMDSIIKLSEISDRALPFTSLQLYFEGNTEEESIAPNQWGYGRPSLEEMYKQLQIIEARKDVELVLVGLHDDWVDAIEDKELWPTAENIHIYSSASQGEVESWIKGFEADGVIIGWPYGEHPEVLKPTAGYHVYTICWD